ncbi:hypothetical protein ARMSODRAFT_1011053 [Armillaria solidipes]|uniref:Fido domain-containing protein n=1 Tax=Armillaria solidipes TaxID=1076256 RepID=A0A2H3C5Y9_9AGAR|nr:hypothetical protein ARMSODRAFT_1011053 [Armillaria solidipes]
MSSTVTCLLTPTYATILNTRLVHPADSIVVKPNELKSALVRPLQIARYEPHRSKRYLAASLAYGIVKNHPFIDGNKRTGFLLGHMYLRAQGLPGLVTQDEDVTGIVDLFVSVADGSVGLEELSKMLELHP